MSSLYLKFEDSDYMLINMLLMLRNITNQRQCAEEEILEHSKFQTQDKDEEDSMENAEDVIR